MTIIYSGKRLSVEKVMFSGVGGLKKERIIVRPADAVVMLPLVGDSCYLIRQFRYAIDRYIYEAPAGTIDEGETPEMTAHRELIEETGFRAEKFIPRGYIYSTPGFTTEKLYMFEARDLIPSNEYDMDDDEDIEVIKVSNEDALGMITEGSIVDAKTICIISRCLLI